MKYRQTVDLEARQFPPLTPGWHAHPPMSLEALAAWCGGALCEAPDGRAYIVMSTPWGDLRAWPGDWIVPGVQFRFYPVKAEDFQATRKPVEATP